MKYQVLFPFLTMATSSSGLTLYGSQGSRSPLVNWGASEVGVSITMGNLQNNPHPFGQIPCLTDDDDVLVFESGAILQYVYSKAAETNGDSPARKAAITSWISWANASLDPICFLETPEGKVYVVSSFHIFCSCHFLCNQSLIYLPILSIFIFSTFSDLYANTVTILV